MPGDSLVPHARVGFATPLRFQLQPLVARVAATHRLRVRVRRSVEHRDHEARALFSLWRDVGGNGFQSEFARPAPPPVVPDAAAAPHGPAFILRVRRAGAHGVDVWGGAQTSISIP